MGSKIVGTGFYLPGEAITNEKMAEYFPMIREEWIETVIGTKTRYLSIDFETKNVTHTLAELGEQAARKAIADAGIEPATIDMVVMSTATPDNLMPATVNIISNNIGLNNIPTYQVQSGCCGALQGLEVSRNFLESGVAGTILVIGADICVKYIDLDADMKKMRSNELINYALFGDGAGAVILQKDEGQSGIRIVELINRLTGLGKEPGQLINWLGQIPKEYFSLPARELRKRYQAVKENYKAIQENVPLMAEEVLQELLQKSGKKFEEIGYFLPPQLGGIITNNINAYLGIQEEKAINCVERTGNNGNALPYIQICEFDQQSKSGDIAAGVAIESSKWIKAGILLCKE